MVNTGNSAYIGQPPLNDKDRLIMTGLFGSTTPPKPIVIPPGEPKSAAPGQIIGLSFAIVLVVFITGVRLSNRIFRKGQVFGWDDIVIIPGVMLALTFYANILVRITYGCAGKHLNDCKYQEFAFFIQLGGINQITFFASVTLIKISMCLFIRRITGISSKPWQIANNCFLVILTIWFFITFFINIFQCWPVTAFFNFAIQVQTPQYHCLHTGAISNAFNIINCVFDFLLLMVPIFIIFRVQMPTGKKWRLMGVFFIGIACCVCSAYRSTFGNRHSKDIPYVFVEELSWTIADIFFSAVVASLPGVNALAEIAFSKALGSLRLTNPSSSKRYFSSGASSDHRKLSEATRSNSAVKGLWGRKDSTFGRDVSQERLHGEPKETDKTGTARYSMEITDVELGGLSAPKAVAN